MTHASDLGVAAVPMLIRRAFRFTAQAVAAAAAMRARQIVPIHYGVFDNPPRYTAIADAEERLLRAARQHEIAVVLSPLGEQHPVPSALPQTTRTPA